MGGAECAEAPGWSLDGHAWEGSHSPFPSSILGSGAAVVRTQGCRW